MSARSIPEIPLTAREFERQVRRCLYSVTAEARKEGVQALAGFGAPAVEPLCKALRDVDTGVRVAAARALAEIGDPRAIAPLAEALRRGSRGSPRRLLLPRFLLRLLPLGVLAGLLVGIGWLGLTTGSRPGDVINFFGLIAIYVPALFDLLRDRSPFYRSATEALVRLAERHRQPELHALVPELRALAADVVRQSPETRRTMREAAERIETLTAELRSLPVAATAPNPDAATLPVPAGAADASAAGPAHRERGSAGSLGEPRP